MELLQEPWEGDLPVELRLYDEVLGDGFLSTDDFEPGPVAARYVLDCPQVTE